MEWEDPSFLVGSEGKRKTMSATVRPFPPISFSREEFNVSVRALALDERTGAAFRLLLIGRQKMYCRELGSFAPLASPTFYAASTVRCGECGFMPSNTGRYSVIRQDGDKCTVSCFHSLLLSRIISMLRSLCVA